MRWDIGVGLSYDESSAGGSFVFIGKETFPVVV